MKKYSPSSVNQFFQCPYQWKLLCIDEVEGLYVENHKALLGANIHSIIKEYFKLIGSNPTMAQIKNVAMACFNGYFDEQLKLYRAEAENMIKNFIQFEQTRFKNGYKAPILVEEILEDDCYKGIIDYFDGEKIIDWKTGALMTLGDDERRQGIIYNILLNNNGYTGNFKVFFVTLKNGRCLELPRTTAAWMTEQANKMFTMVQNGVFPKCKSGLCGWCSVQLECEFSEIGLWDGVACL